MFFLPAMIQLKPPIPEKRKVKDDVFALSLIPPFIPFPPNTTTHLSPGYLPFQVGLYGPGSSL